MSVDRTDLHQSPISEHDLSEPEDLSFSIRAAVIGGLSGASVMLAIEVAKAHFAEQIVGPSGRAIVEHYRSASVLDATVVASLMFGFYRRILNELD